MSQLNPLRFGEGRIDGKNLPGQLDALPLSEGRLGGNDFLNTQKRTPESCFTACFDKSLGRRARKAAPVLGGHDEYSLSCG